MSKQQNSHLPGGVSKLGKRAFFITLIFCLFAQLPPVKNWLELAESKFSDVLFSLISVECPSSGLKRSKVLIVNKDQTFIDRFGRSPDRSDFANLLNVLKDSGVETVALDFIFDEKGENLQANQKLKKSLKDFSFPILANHFIPRGLQNYSTANITDYNSERPPWPTSLYRDFSQNAASTGLINIFSDFDGVIRYAPLAFLPDEKKNYLPTLGFAAWIAEEVKQNLPKEIFSEPDKTITNIASMVELINKAPFQRHSTGHQGLDKLIKILELKFVLRKCLLNTNDFVSPSEEKIEFYSKNIGNKTFVNIPSSPLPLIGPDSTPCIRIPFKRRSPPYQEDHIESLSMSLLLKTELENSSNRIRKNEVKISSEKPFEVSDFFVWTEPGNSQISGKLSNPVGMPCINSTVMVINQNNGYWEKTTTLDDGTFHLKRLPAGPYSLEIITKNHGLLQISRSNKIWDLAKDNVIEVNCCEIPLLNKTLCIPEHKDIDDYIIWGESLNILPTDSSGKLPQVCLPSSYEFIPLDEEIEFSQNNGICYNPNKTPLRNLDLAIIDSSDPWKHSFLFRGKIRENGIKLPASLDCQIALTSSQEQSKKQLPLELQVVKEQEILPENKIPTISLSEKKVKIEFPFTGTKNEINLLFLADTGEIKEIPSSTTAFITEGNYRILASKGSKKGIYNQLRAKIAERPVFIGTSLAEDQDLQITPINFMNKGFSRIPGVNLHANICEALLNKNFINSPFFHFDKATNFWPVLQTLLLLPIILLINHIFIAFGAYIGALLTILIIPSWVFLAILSFTKGTLLPVIFPVTQIALFSIGKTFIEWIISRNNEIAARSTFGRFISPEIVEQILKNPDALKPGGEKKELTVIFTDLAGFTSISEKLPPDELTDFMNEYLDAMTRIVFKYGGTLDKYIGDAIMAFWNHPTSQKNHAQLAVDCAIAMQNELELLRDGWHKRGLPEVSMRAGINTSTCMVGFIGSSIQMNFTCLGDGVNLAARLEGANKEYGTLIMISESVKDQLEKNSVPCRFLDYLAVKGKNEPIKVFEVVSGTEAKAENWEEFLKLYKLGIHSYLGKEWKNAEKHFKTALKIKQNDGPCLTYIDRCKHFSNFPPPENWDGRFEMKTK